MSITIGPPLETELRAKADAEGITVEAYLERLLRADGEAMNELAGLVLDGLKSGEPISPGPEYWADKHSKLDDRFKSTR